MRLLTAGAMLWGAFAAFGSQITLQSQTFSQWTPLCDGLDQTASVALADIDGDRDLDLVVANGMHLAQADWVLLNDGHGMFYGRRPLGGGIQPDPSYGVAVGDLDGDGALDLVIANDLALAPVYRNDGKGNFSQIALLGNYLAPQPRRAVGLGDLDADGDLDVALVGLGQDHLYLNDGGGRRWTERVLGVRQAGFATRATAVALADVDGDKDLDVVLPARGDVRSLILLNDGRGGFAETRFFDDGPEDTTSIAMADVDRDGDIDIVAANWEQPHAVYLNDGRGYFKKGATFGSGREQTWTVVLGDMDLDGDVDAVVGNVNIGFWNADLNADGRSEQFGRQARNEPSRVYINDGSGRFTSGSPLSSGTDNTRPLSLGDVDTDGDLDVVMGNTCQPNQIFFNPLRGPERK